VSIIKGTGEFHGTMQPITPYGSRTVKPSVVRFDVGAVTPSIVSALPAEYRREWATPAA
jgi:hypothetical protein